MYHIKINMNILTLFRNSFDTFLKKITLIHILDEIEITNKISIPRFCFHRRLNSSGNCRMCLTQVSGIIKPIISCCYTFISDIVVLTKTLLILKAREYILEFLLINHPLDCPICDQGSECDLQDISYIHGVDGSRFNESKKAIFNKHLIRIIKTNMNRCIYCTRCVRFSIELNFRYIYNVLGRGISTEIGNYFNLVDYYSNYMDGNVIDLCPVGYKNIIYTIKFFRILIFLTLGAITSKPYLFKARVWEALFIESIDIFDSLCSNIRIDIIGNEIERILPKRNDDLNHEWITDKIRFVYDGFKYQRILLPFYRKVSNFMSFSWHVVLFIIKKYFYLYEMLHKNKFFFYIYTGQLLDIYSTYLLNTKCQLYNIPNINLNLNWHFDLRNYFLLNSQIKLLENSNFFIYLCLNPRIDSPIINMKVQSLKYKLDKTNIEIIYIGRSIKLNYSVNHIGITINTYISLLLCKHFYVILFTTTKDLYNNINCLYSIDFNTLSDITNTLIYVISKSISNVNFICNYLSLYSSDINISELAIKAHYYSKNLYIKPTKTTKIYYLLGLDFNKMAFSDVQKKISKLHTFSYDTTYKSESIYKKLNYKHTATLDAFVFYIFLYDFVYNHIMITFYDVSYSLNKIYIYDFLKQQMFIIYKQLSINLIINQTSHKTLFKKADIYLPCNTFVENNSFFFNCEGRLGISNLATYRKSKTLSNEHIISILFRFVHSKKDKKINNIFYTFFMYQVTKILIRYKYEYTSFYLFFYNLLKLVYIPITLSIFRKLYYCMDNISLNSLNLKNLLIQLDH